MQLRLRSRIRAFFKTIKRVIWYLKEAVLTGGCIVLPIVVFALTRNLWIAGGVAICVVVFLKRVHDIREDKVIYAYDSFVHSASIRIYNIDSLFEKLRLWTDKVRLWIDIFLHD